MKLLKLFVSSLFILLLTLHAFAPNKVFAFNLFGSILGDGDESDGEDQKDDEDEEDEEEKEDEKKTETRKTTVNPDGTRTVVKRKVEDNGKVEVQSKTYSIDGKVVEEQKIKSGDNENEIEDEFKGISEMKFKSKSGDDFKLMIKNEDKSLTKVVYDSIENNMRVVGKPDDDGDDVLIRDGEDGTYEVEKGGEKMQVLLPLTVDDSDGSISVLTGSGEKTLTNFPDEILKKARSKDASIEVSDVKIKEKDGKVIYELSAEKAEKLLGLFQTKIASLVTYDVETGNEIQSQQDFWNKIMDALSF
ncbi:hypothetical protein CO058_00610 [candidate division WWE3 bacterium CG_4_9_14_0_2_um_filter_35_11]|uniref:DUF5666 domain-containing protein n=1 Tax=candidate division WWE3 bacterium CG_4_9_14_0_2_um_filter_35_11 TaxID=1975077 RepID=A0A2M8EMM7_UNCKA|nr:MAG: hypothetical protein COV25_01430 [candidate division WWE3 bacterium CG10_big_fil_rev_8_21_14_0_10_35_32]PJC23978.1 MAG: hypothetical protein CO058_00610 [candidate division WWE3 bacterium CG_4_9_14_0_2_um_filter_35_11]